MANLPRSEYLGFSVNDQSRIYRLQVRQPDGGTHEFTLAIANQAFLSKRVRYQDAPEICYLKLERELIACGESLPASQLEITDAELDEYREAHTAKPSKNRPKWPG